MSTVQLLLAPRPQRLERTGDGYTLPEAPLIYLASRPQELRPAAERLALELAAAGLRPQLTACVVYGDGRPDVHVTLRIDPALVDRPQGYRLSVDPSGVTIIGHDGAGVFYGICTLIQLLRQHAPVAAGGPITLPGLRIDDRPDFAHRGVMLDISRDRVPTMQTLYDLIDLLASWKINQVQLYMEHTFAYRGHEVVWKDASPLTGEEIMALDAFCRERYVELVPNQNSFGHMHRWLIHEPYRRLAECPQGIEHPFSPRHEPFSLCPIDPGSLALLEDLYGQLLPHFSSRQFNVGLDETFDLGRCRSAQVCAERGRERVYLDFLLQVHWLVSRHGRTMQFWGDIIINRPELIAELPQDVIALEWGYEADHPFAEHGRLFAAAGRSFYVCPGTSTWNSIAGRTENALGNLRNAAQNGRANGAIGYLNTDWGDNGHLQPLPVSYLGFLAGAALSWNSADAGDPQQLDIAALLDRYAFQDRAGVMGRVAYDLGNAYLQPGVTVPNSSVLFWLLLYPDRPLSDPRLQGLSLDRLYHTHGYIEGVADRLAGARMERPDADLVTEEFRWAAHMLRLACRIGIARLSADPEGALEAVPADQRAALADELRGLIEQHRALWLRRSRPGGLSDSVARLERAHAALLA
jgi:hexosaminidase